MRRLALLVALLLLTACAPRVEGVLSADNGAALITITANQPLYSATLSVLNATIDDPRCGVLNETDAGCILGDLAEGSVTVFTAARTGPNISCIVFGLSGENVTSYRPYPCKVAEGG